MRHLLEVLPGADLPDPARESDAPGVQLTFPDDDDLLRPATEEELLGTTSRGALSHAAPSVLGKHLVWTFGPIHRALPFPLALRVELDGDRLSAVDPECGFLHQGLEKRAELEPFAFGFQLMEQLSPRRPVGHQLAYALLVERAFGWVGRCTRATQLWRLVALEALRITEHLVLLAHPALAPNDRGLADGVRQHAANAADALDALCAGGIFAAAGGLLRAPSDADAAPLRALMTPLHALVHALRSRRTTLTSDVEALDGHLAGKGTLDRPTAVACGISGPALRACGLPDDARVQSPAFAYDSFVLQPATAQGGCVRARLRVRVDELQSALILLEQAFKALASASHDVTPPHEVQAVWTAGAPHTGVARAVVELPSGELSLALAFVAGALRPSRLRIRGPSAALVAALPNLLVGNRIDDVAPVLASLGLNGAELDR